MKPQDNNSTDWQLLGLTALPRRRADQPRTTCRIPAGQEETIDLRHQPCRSTRRGGTALRERRTQ